MRKLHLFAALSALALCWAAESRAQSSAQMGQSFRGVIAPQLSGGMTTDSLSAPDQHDSSYNKLVKEASPLNEKLMTAATVYNDTMSYNGKQMDSTAVVSPIGLYRVVNLTLKLEGAQTTAGGVVRIGVTCIMSHSAVASDTVFSAVMMPSTVDGVTITHSTATIGVDSLGAGADGVASASNAAGVPVANRESLVRLMGKSAVSLNYTASRTVTLGYYNPGYEYVRWVFRHISEPATLSSDTTTPQAYRLRAVIGGRVQ